MLQVIPCMDDMSAASRRYSIDELVLSEVGNVRLGGDGLHSKILQEFSLGFVPVGLGQQKRGNLMSI